MARITLTDRSKNRVYLQDLDRKQREAAVYPPGQDVYIHPIDKDELKDKLEEIGGSTVTDSEVDDFINSTVGDGSSGSQGGDDISLSNIDAAAQGDTSAISSGLTTSEQQDLQDILSYHLVETGKFKLSFDRGVISELNADNWVKVWPDNAAGTYSL